MIPEHDHDGINSPRIRASHIIWDTAYYMEWDEAFLRELTVEERILPDDAVGADIGDVDLPFGRIYARQLIATGDGPGFPALIRSPRYDGVSGQDIYTYVDDPDSDRWWRLRNSDPNHWLGLDVEGELKVGGIARLDTSPVQLNTIFDYGDINIEPSPASSDGTVYIRHQGEGSAHLSVSGNIIVGGTVDGVDISAHAADSSAHHARYTDSEAISAVESAQFTDLEAQKLFNSLGDLILQAYSASGVPRVHIQDTSGGDADLEVARDIIVGGTVDGVDISAHVGDADAHHGREHDHSNSLDGDYLNPLYFNCPTSAPTPATQGDMRFIDGPQPRLEIYSSEQGAWVGVNLS